MPALAVVEDLNVFKDCGLGLSACFEVLAMNQFLFQRGKEAFHWRIVQALALAAHRLRELGLFDLYAIISPSVLTASVHCPAGY